MRGKEVKEKRQQQAPSPQTGTYQVIAITKISPSKDNYRKTCDKKAMQDLIESVKNKGIIQPILVRALSGSGAFEIVAGHRRYNAATAAGLPDIPAIVRELSDEDALELQVIENSQREDPNPMEEAWGFKRLLDMGKHTPETLAAKLDRSIDYVLGRIKLLKIPQAAQDKVASGEISQGHALLLTRLKHDSEQKQFLKIITGDNGITIKAAKAQLKNFSRDITDAIFDTAKCETCPYLSRNQAVLFAELKKSGECMDRSCYFQSTWDHHKQALDKMKAAGFTVIIKHEGYIQLYNKKTSSTITPPGSKGYDTKPKRYKTECMKCTEHHAFYLYQQNNYSGKSISSGELCLNNKCLHEMQNGKQDKSSSASGSDPVISAHRAIEKACDCRNRFLSKALTETLSGGTNLTAAQGLMKMTLRERLLIYHLLDRFPRFQGRAEIIKKYYPGYKDAHGYGSHNIYKAIAQIPEGETQAALRDIERAIIALTDPLVLLQMTAEAGIDMTKDFAVDEEFLKSKTKPELLDYIKKFSLGINLTESAKKGDIIKAILEHDLRGKLPDECIEACNLGDYLDHDEEDEEWDDGEPTCRVCGCTDSTPCDGGCSWVDDGEMGDICSQCADKKVADSFAEVSA